MWAKKNRTLVYIGRWGVLSILLLLLLYTIILLKLNGFVQEGIAMTLDISLRASRRGERVGFSLGDTYPILD